MPSVAGVRVQGDGLTHKDKLNELLLAFLASWLSAPSGPETIISTLRWGAGKTKNRVVVFSASQLSGENLNPSPPFTC